MTVTVYYMTEAKLSKTLGEGARIVDQEFQALEEAKLAAFPNGVVFGYIPACATECERCRRGLEGAAAPEGEEGCGVGVTTVTCGVTLTMRGTGCVSHPCQRATMLTATPAALRFRRTVSAG
jgi:hypothetical protein